MILREPITGTYLLITVLCLALSGELFSVFSSNREADCHRRNAALLAAQHEGPLQACGGDDE